MLDAAGPRSNAKRAVEGEPRRVVRCGACGGVVARLDDRVRIGAGDLHVFVNPQGQVFELLCFAEAAGAAAVGDPTLEFTWFPGHAWRFAICRACGVQLGWRYDGTGGERRFWGLDRGRLDVS